MKKNSSTCVFCVPVVLSIFDLPSTYIELSTAFPNGVIHTKVCAKHTQRLFLFKKFAEFSKVSTISALDSFILLMSARFNSNYSLPKPGTGSFCPVHIQ